ncbi:PAS/PAC sensor signal transduction histidine kinase [Luminiphilus syltensis NOR5-1B]|uniref:Ribosomal RNA small subunit methyltransferase E n=1 Tax=Luminiphilus syltensis NOR5-1B TaxID=565045 RepID=B8KU69_9GAMM|nr:16S rRNA (uracil(1498)-N(3))-methyltransferase [Luminiphilus syltensis]EED34237.1 PAS/PAC sensor signal transduction histidine kinase [Luminiphilus syltensis NOR5-1B]
MRTPRIFADLPLAQGAEFTLPDNASLHIGRVLRLDSGQPLTVFNGDGEDYHATITTVTKRSVSIEVHSVATNGTTSPLEVELGLALSKGDRFDWAVQKATELGVAHITPLVSERVEVRLNPQREEKKRTHWHNIVISACEQCGRSTLAGVSSPTQLRPWLERVEAPLKLVLDHRSATALPEEKPDRVALLIGPEGGLTESELELAEASGFQRLQLGPRVLRTETAPVVALSVLGNRWGDLQT